MKRKTKLKKIFRKKPTPKLIDSDQPNEAVRITNDNLPEHRKEVLSSARKYIYPLQHSKHRIVMISTGLFIAVVVAFFSYCTIALYNAKSNTDFLYDVTRVVPFPVAKAGPDFVAYENYLFELRHYIHYYQTQQGVDFNSESGKQQLAVYKQQALNEVINDAYVTQIAKKNHITVSNQELNNQINIVQNQNLLGASEKSFEDVLKDNFGWTLNDFRRSLKQQMLAQKVAATLDTNAQKQANAALTELQKGVDFATVAKQYSDDTLTKDNGGQFSSLIDQTTSDLSAQTTYALFKLKPGQSSGIINNGSGLEIVKNISIQGNKIQGAHILINYQDVNTYVNQLKDTEKTQLYIKL